MIESLRTRLLRSAILTSGVLSTTVVEAVDFFVPSQVPTIQGAIDLAADGDRVLVEPGTYFEAVDFLGKGIILESTGGPEVTILDGSLVQDTIVRMVGTSQPRALRGFTLQSGGVWANTSPLIAGGAVRVDGPNATIQGNILKDNFGAFGGALKLSGGGWILGNAFITNQGRQGGAVWATGSNLVIADNTFHDNLATDFSGDLGDGWGGAVFICNGSTTFRNNLFLANTASHQANSSSGGAVFIESEAPDYLFESNSFIGNSAFLSGVIGGLGVSSADARNCLFWDNTTSLPNQDQLDNLLALNSVEFSLAPGGVPGFGNIDADPLLVFDADGLPYLSHLAAGQAADSPCIDTGDPTTPLFGGSTRLDGVVDGNVVDIGYHHPSPLAPFVRGDCDQDGAVNIADAIRVLEELFIANTPLLGCQDACDANDDGSLNIADPIRILSFLFSAGPPPAPPHPSCGVDPTTSDPLGCVTPCP